MNSIAIWGKGIEDNISALTLGKLNINYWYMNCGKRSGSCIDLGVMINDFEALEEISFYFPFKFGAKDISDLGTKLSNYHLAGAVFNEELQVNLLDSKAFYAHSAHVVAALDAQNDGFIIYSLDVVSDMEISESNGDGGTIVSIHLYRMNDLREINSLHQCKRCYLRFRVNASSIDTAFVFGRNYNFIDALFHNTLSTVKMVDFRVNQSRSLPLTLRERIKRSGGFLGFEAVHFLLLTKDTTDVSSDLRSSTRRLESDIWDDYLPPSCQNGIQKEPIVIAHHWKGKPFGAQEILFDWDIFVKMKLMHKSIVNIVIYIVFGLLLGCCADLVSRWLLIIWPNAV